MPHPLTTHPVALSLVELAALAGLALIHGTIAIADAISEADWSKLTGPHSGVFVLAMVALAMAWKSREDTKERKAMAKTLQVHYQAVASAATEESEARERRHKEALASSEKHASAILALSQEHAESLLKITAEGNEAITNSTSTFKDLIEKLSTRTCLSIALRKDFSNLPQNASE
jgi:hypothetical protein